MARGELAPFFYNKKKQDMGCLTSLVGITSGNCACIDTDGELANTTGLYIDDMEYGIQIAPIKNSADCGAGTIVDIITRAREEAEREFYDLFRVHIDTYNQLRLRDQNDIIGKYKSNPALSSNPGDLMGWRLQSRAIKGSYYRINTLTLHIPSPINPATERTLTVYNKEGDILNTIEVVPNIATPVNKTIDISQDIYILWDASINNDFPASNKMTCGCAGQSNGFLKYFEPIGVYGDTINSIIEGGANVTNMAYGITINGLSECSNIEEWACSRLTQSNLSGYDRTMARVYQLLVIRRCISYIIQSNVINRYTILDAERLSFRRNKVNKAIDDYMQWLAVNLVAEGNTDCYLCKSSRVMKRKTILV